jgi:hypothetical protein
MMRTASLMLGVAALVAAALSTPASARPYGVKVGFLTCHVQSGWGYVIGSSKHVSCRFRPSRYAVPDRYTGSMTKFGIDVGYTGGGTMVWGVFAPTSDVHAGALAGEYAGATASATVGAGVGANVLVGGLDKSITLQPVSMEGNTGLDVSGGIGAMRLDAD